MATDRPKLLEFGIAEETAWRAGLPCGGTIKIYVEPLRHERDSGYLETALATRSARRWLAVLTTLETGVRRLFDTQSRCPRKLLHARMKARASWVETADGQAFLHVLNAEDGVALVNIPQGVVGNLPT
jgi:xanthine dehydrogenase accessory factor